MTNTNQPTIALICAAGLGTRAGGGIPKQYQTVLNQPMLAHTIAAFSTHACISKTFVVVAAADAWYCELIAPYVADSVTVLRVGGDTRAESICNALSYLDELFDGAWVMVHDAARPCVTAESIQCLYHAVICANSDAGGLLALPVIDTVKLSDDGIAVKKTVPRQSLYLAQTPQMFPLQLLYNALADALVDDAVAETITDDSSVMERAGYDPQLILGEVCNIKVTVADDFKLAAFWLQTRNGS